jgi:hypothetical protein
MLWIINRRWWVLAAGLLLVLLGVLLSGPGTDIRIALGGLGLFLIIWAVFGILLAIPMALRDHREGYRPHHRN